MILSVVSTCNSASARLLKWGHSPWERAQLLPLGEQRLSFKIQTYQTQQQFGGNGSLVDSGHTYKETTNFRELIQQTGEEGLKIRALLKKEGINEDTPVLTTEFSLDTFEVQSEISWSRGLTSWWMVGINLPYIESETKVKTTQTLSPEFSKLKEKTSKPQRSSTNIQTFVANNKSEAVQLELNSNKYDGVGEKVQYRGIGDVELLSQMRLFEKAEWVAAFRQRVSVPTGKNQDPYTYIKSNSADGQMDIGFDVLFDYQANRHWVLTATLGYTFQLSDTQALRVPDGTASQIDWSVDQDVKRDLGDIFLARVNSLYQFVERIWLTAGVEWTEKQKDSYSGNYFEEWQYSLMGQSTQESRQMARLGFRYKSPTWRYDYMSKSYVTAGVEYLSVFNGRNTPKADAAALEFTLSY